MVSSDNARARINLVFLRDLNIDLSSTQDDLFDSGHLDSLGFVDLIFHLEREFEIPIELDTIDFDDFRTVECIAKYVEDRLANG